MSFQKDKVDYDDSQSLNEEELERKIMRDDEQLEFDENDSMLNFQNSSIYFIQHIKKLNEMSIQRDLEHAKEIKVFKEKIKNNKYGQEIFEEMDRELANVKKMIKVKMKKDPQPVYTVKPISKIGTRLQMRIASKLKDEQEQQKQNDIYNNENMSNNQDFNLQKKYDENNIQDTSKQNMQKNQLNSEQQINKIELDYDFQQDNNEQTEFINGEDEENESLVEIIDIQGEKIKCKPDSFTKSQLMEIKEKARIEVSQKAKEFVFAEDIYKKEFMKNESFLSDEDSIMSQEVVEDLNDAQRITNCFMICSTNEKIEQMKKSQIENLSIKKNESIYGLSRDSSLPGLAQNSNTASKMRNSRVEKNNQQFAVMPEVKRKQFSSNKNILIQKDKNLQNSIQKSKTEKGKNDSQKNNELVMNGQNQLKSSITESIIFKQQLEQKLESKQDKINQEREICDMENEDLLSLEYEEYFQKRVFYQKNYKLPSQFPLQVEQETPSCQDIFYNDNMIQILNIDFDEPLNLNDYENVLTRDCFQVCIEDESKVSNRHRLGRTTINSQQEKHQQDQNINTSNISQPDYSYQSSYNLTVRNTNKHLAENQNKQQSQSKPEYSDKLNIAKIIILQKDNQKQFIRIEGEQAKEILNTQNMIIKVSKTDDKQEQKLQQYMNSNYKSVIEIYQNKMQQLHQQLLLNYEKNNLFIELERIFVSHQPKLIKQFFDIEQENIFQDDEDFVEDSIRQNQSISVNKSKIEGGDIRKSLKQFLQFDIFKNFEKKRRLEIKLENLGDMDGLEKLPNLEILTLSVNKIDKLDKFNQLINCKIIELNLSQNNIINYSQIKNLKELRYLNLEQNKITSMADLSNCKHLEVLNLNTNQIKKIDNLQNNKQLRKLYLFQNKIERIDESLKQNLFLEELDLGRNVLVSIDGLQNNVLLKKLVVYCNQLKELPKNFSFIFMVKLYLNGNKLTDISGLQYLPCLEYLHVGHNQIEKITTIPMMPNLTTLIASFNHIQNFESVLNLVRASPNIKYIGFNDNDFVKGNISDDLRELYDYLFLRYLPRLIEINHQGVDIGKKRYLEMRFNQILKQKCSVNSNAIQSFLNKFTIITREYIFIQQQKKNRQTNLFAQNIAFYILDSSYTFNHLISMQNIISSSAIQQRPSSSKRSSSSSLRASSIVQSNLSQALQTANSLLNPTNVQSINILNQSIFFQKDFFDNKHKKSIHKIKSLGFKSKFKISKNQKYYKKNLQKIMKIQKLYRGYHIRKLVNFRQIFSHRNKLKYAIKIQKVYRGYRLRKRLKQKLSKVKYQDDDDLPEFDDAWLNQQLDDYDTGLKLPDNFDIQQFINPRKIQQTENKLVNTNHFPNQSALLKNKQLPPLSNKSQPLIQSNNLMQNGSILPNINQKPSSPLIKQKTHPKSVMDKTVFLNSQKSHVNSRIDNTTDSDFNALLNKDDNFSQSGVSMKNENPRKNTQSMMAPKQLHPIKSVKKSEEEKQKIIQEHHFTQPELVFQKYAYQIEKKRKSQIKQQPLNSKQCYDNSLKVSKK